MFGFFLDMFRGMPCPVCCRRGLFGVMSRDVREGIELGLRVNPGWVVARCRRCGARCIASRRGDDEPYRKATDEEWQAHAYDDLPAARARPR